MELLNNIASSPDPLHQVDLGYRRPSAYGKMETLIKEMQDEESGVPVRSQKVFLGSIPAAFAGYDMIEWLMDRLNIEDSAEAIHMANLLCQHGYFFPVGSSSTNHPNLSFSVKDDSSLYRFQTPFYWPNRTCLSNSSDTSVDYAIYLSKRTLRNKQKHALEDHEQEAYNDLKRCLGSKWDFVAMQADEQVRLSKERKKQDKLVMDSQERAYWRVLKPPPGVPCCIDTPPTYKTQRACKAIRKTNHILLEDLRNEVELLRNSCIRTRIKVSCALESLANHCESYAEHDPFLTPRLPSNPWHSDDPTFWILNADLVDLPTERRLKKWGISMEDVIFDQTGLREFTAYLKKEYCHENIRIWLDVREMRYGPMSLLRARAQQIYNEFLAPGSPCEINIDMRTMEAVQKELNFLVPSRFTFDPAAEHVYTMLLKKDCYPRFIRSEHYKGLLHQSQQISLKNSSKRLDKFFSFVAERKKKPSSSEEHKVTKADTSLHHHQQQQHDTTTSSGLADNVPYRGDFDNNRPKAGNDDGDGNSLDDICCPWDTSSSVKSDRTTSTDRNVVIRNRVVAEPVVVAVVKQEEASVVVKSDKVLTQKSVEEEATLQPDENNKKKPAIVQEGLPQEPPKPVQPEVLLQRQLSKQSSTTSSIRSEDIAMCAAAATTTVVTIPPTTEEEVVVEETLPQATSAAVTLSVSVSSPLTSKRSVDVRREEVTTNPPVEKEDDVEEPTQEQEEMRKLLNRKKSTTSSTSSAELVCPWDCENGSAPEQSTFTKTYSTLGYL